MSDKQQSNITSFFLRKSPPIREKEAPEISSVSESEAPSTSRATIELEKSPPRAHENEVSEKSSMSESEASTTSSSQNESEMCQTESQSATLLNDKCIGQVRIAPGRKGVRKRVFCTVCLPHPTVLKRLCYRGRIPPICLAHGTEARAQTIKEHLLSKVHQECLKVDRLNKLSAVQKSQVPLLKMLSSQRQKLANKIGSLIIHVYNDAKCLTASAFSWPSRVVAAKMAHLFNYNHPFTPYNPTDFDLQYIRPAVVQELLRTIVCADLPRIKKEIDLYLAGSFRCDASMDNTQKDHEFMLLNVIKENGERDLKFIGIGYVADRGALGHLAALKAGANDTVGFDNIFRLINHLSTDGENKNTGQHHGLWKLLDDEREKADVNFPLLKSVCAVHSTANAYKDLCKSVPEIDHLVNKLSGIAKFFHSSAQRTTELEQIAKTEDLTVRSIPKYFEVRWSQFTAALLDSILYSRRALVNFCMNQSVTERRKFLKLLTNKDNLLMMCFIADLLLVLKVFQKKLQSDSLTIIDIEEEAKKFKKTLDNMNKQKLLGGWEEAFKEKFDEESNKFCGIELWEKTRRRTEATLNVTDRREFSAIRNESILAIKEFIDQRLEIDQSTSKYFTPFTKFTATNEEIRDVHKSIAPDLDLANLAIQYKELQNCTGIPKDNPYKVLQSIIKGGKEEYNDEIIVLSRILVCKPHSADCERVISQYNKVKSTCRASFDRQTVSDYLYINMNMPPLCEYDPRPAILRWMDDKDRRTRDTPKASKQEWFKKLFSNQDGENVQ